MGLTMTTLDQFTLTTVPFEQCFDDTPLGQGIRLIWPVRDQYYLVTNWHVLSMCNFFTRANLRNDAGRPNILRTLLNARTRSFDKQRWDIKIRGDDDNPLRLVHPDLRADVAIFPRSGTNDVVNQGVVALVDTPLNKLIGVYPGRMPADHLHEAQIGLIWDGSLIDEIIAGNIRDE